MFFVPENEKLNLLTGFLVGKRICPIRSIFAIIKQTNNKANAEEY